MPSILISGASIAGPALAHWLGARGWATTVVERFDRVRDEGQNIDVRGVGREVLRRMGVEEAVRAEHTTELGLRFVDERGAAVAEFPAAQGDGRDSATAELEILRGRLSAVLHAHTPGTEYVFGDQITSLDQDEDGVTAGFASGGRRRFDVVAIAEGLHSRTRRLAFPGDHVRELDMYAAYLTIPRTADDDRWWYWHQCGRRRSAMLRPDNLGTTRAMLFFLSETRGLDDLDPSARTHVLRRTFADARWEVPRILDALDSAPTYFESVGQARLPRWSDNRVVLVGDAAHCASPISGMSTTLALTGAYVLGNELATAPDHRTALANYERLLRPFVDRAQKLPPGTPRLANPQGRRELTALRGALRLVAGVQRFAPSLPAATPADKFTLPDYPAA
ncbi:FAD-dependent monooxygenase [Actinokineospora bangkokensis]|uniref:FAD-dependent monooxygenase n=1 Tax=Actinokineospora bangkokensis TaxID=1193682 RepID=UPI000A7EB4B7|nr:FAD-dependent monooxygenase [Actinokineospora bangkokensis]